MKLSPVINVEVPMSSEMLHALNRHEAVCACKRVDSVSIEQVKTFLTDKYDAKFASTFKPEYLISKSL